MINLAKYSLLVYLLLKPYYLFASGGLQIADIFLLLSFVLLFVESRLSSDWRSELARTIQEQRLIFIFVALTFIINTLYFFTYLELKFFLSSSYYVFNLLAIIAFAIFLKDRHFLSRIGSVFKFNLVIQLALWASHIGRYFDADRYMGTLNDPNQFGYYILISFLFIYATDIALGKGRTYIYYLLTILLIFLSGSTGMLLGIGVFSALIAAYYIKQQLKSPYKMVRRIMHSTGIFLGLLVLLFPIVFTVIDSDHGDVFGITEAPLFLRISEKQEQASGEASKNIFEDRGLDVLGKYPHFMIFGAGEGAYRRFTMMNNYGNEVHSTLPSILFYYGLLPLVVLLLWIRQNLRGIGWRFGIAATTLLTVSFILLNQRQSLFWVFIVMMSILSLYTSSSRSAIGAKSTEWKGLPQ